MRHCRPAFLFSFWLCNDFLNCVVTSAFGTVGYVIVFSSLNTSLALIIIAICFCAPLLFLVM